MKAKVLKAPAKRLIQKMIATVTAHPETVDQGSYPEGEGVCSSTFCAAGHLVFAKSPRLFNSLLKHQRENGDSSVNWRRQAAQVLQLPYNAETNSIFGSHWEWPHKFRDAYTKASNFKTEKARKRGQTKAFVARWQQLLDNEGAELI